jgi:hypothetical protein
MAMIHEHQDVNLYEEMREIKTLLKQVLDVLVEVHELQEDIKIFEGRQAMDEQRIANAVKRKRFSSVFEWKNAIWERCPNKVEHVTKDTVSFHCTLLKGPCMFESCPRNFIEDDPYTRTHL